jgi:O-antigen ligase
MQSARASLAGGRIRVTASDYVSGGTPAILFALAAMPLVIAAFVDLTRDVNFGRVTGMGALTIVQSALLFAALIACASYPKRLLLYAGPFLGFLIWTFVSTVWFSTNVSGFQNAAVFALFGLALLLAGTVTARDPSRMESTIDRAVRWVDAIGLLTIFANLLLRGTPAEANWSVGPRSVALVGLIALSWHLAEAYHDQRGPWIRSAIWLLAIVLTLSRTASAIALLYVTIVLVLQVRFNPRSFAASLPRSFMLLAIIIGLVFQSVAFQDRFFTGDTSIAIGEIRINASGRLNMWPVVLDSLRESPIIGKGLGSSQQIVEATVADAGHPHNDYLRVAHDLGVVGFGLLALAFVSWLCVTFRGWSRLARRRADWGRMELAAFLGLLGLMLEMMTDNGIVYPFYMGPLGILIGAGLGRSQPKHLYRQGMTTGLLSTASSS